MATRRRASRQSVTGALTDLQRRVRYLQNRPAPTSLGNHSVIRSAIQPRAVSTDQIATNAISNDQIQADAVREAQILDDSITRDKIQNGEVVAGKLGQDSVFRGNITDGEVVDGKLAESSVNLINMKPNSVANTQLTTDSVNFRTVDTNAIGNENMLDNSVGNGELQNDSVGSGELQGDSVGFSELQASSVGTSTLQTGAVTRSKIGSAQVGTTQIENRAVTGGKIALGGVGINEINMDRVGPYITSEYVYSGSGISVLGGTVSANFGGGSNQIPRGNHRHSYTYFYFTRDSRGLALQNLTSRSSTTGTPSSKKYKKDIQSHKISDPKKLLDLDLKKYKYKRSLGGVHEIKHREWMHGYLAEDLIDMGFEEVVHYDSKGNPDALDYGLFSTLVLELVKLQQTEIEYLKEEIKDLKEAK